MKVIFSRKGFDSSYGGFPSIILPGGKMISFPIPEKGIRKQNKETGEYDNETSAGIKGKGAEDIKFVIDDKTELTLAEIFTQLQFKENKIKVAGKKQLFNETIFHYDPTIQTIYNPDGEEIRGHHGYAAFGQSRAAASHLLNKRKKINRSIGKDDIFLFFGTFKNTEFNEENGTINYCKEEEFHAIWGYMIVDDIFEIDDNKLIHILSVHDKNNPSTKYEGIEEHPHFINQENEKYANCKNIIICGTRFGTFDFTPQHKLTVDGKTKSHWKLPKCFINKDFTYCNKEKNDNSNLFLQSSPIGQEFVLKEEFNKDDKDFKEWLKKILKDKKSLKRLGIE